MQSPHVPQLVVCKHRKWEYPFCHGSADSTTHSESNTQAFTYLSPLTQSEIIMHYCSITDDLKLPNTCYFTDRIAMGCTVWDSNPGGGKTFLTCPRQPQGPPNLLYEGYQVSFPGVSRHGMALTTHSLLVLTFTKEQSYTYTFPLFLHGTL